MGTYYTQLRTRSMRTNIDIDDDLLADAMRLSGLKTKRAVVEEALRRLIALQRQAEIRALRGKLKWEGELDESRLGRRFGSDLESE
jgi:Arc/MetJ family transcription regulator